MYPPPDYQIIMQHIDEMQRLASDRRPARGARVARKAGRTGPARRFRTLLRSTPWIAGS